VTNEQIKWMIEGAKLVYNARPYWQSTAREDVLNALFPKDNFHALAQRIFFERWDKQNDKLQGDPTPKQPVGLITVNGTEAMFKKA
jgi:hypothetical protein